MVKIDWYLNLGTEIYIISYAIQVFCINSFNGLKTTEHFQQIKPVDKTVMTLNFVVNLCIVLKLFSNIITYGTIYMMTAGFLYRC